MVILLPNVISNNVHNCDGTMSRLQTGDLELYAIRGEQ
jgi:hypothetical protein